MRNLIATLSIAAAIGSTIAPATAQVSVGIDLGGVNIGVNMNAYPNLVPVPGYPVYYDPQVNANYFFYDGLYWVYNGDTWYQSTWYNGPWQAVNDQYVPLYVLRVPVRYYRSPPVYFRGWAADAPPRWGDHWGHDWEVNHAGWDHWDRRSVPAPAPLPVYQRQYSGNNYPRAPQQQQALVQQNYHYQPRDAVSRQHFQAQVGTPQTTNQMKPQPVARQAQPVHTPAPVTAQGASPVAKAVDEPASQPERKGGPRTEHKAPAQAQVTPQPAQAQVVHPQQAVVHPQPAPVPHPPQPQVAQQHVQPTPQPVHVAPQGQGQPKGNEQMRAPEGKGPQNNAEHGNGGNKGGGNKGGEQEKGKNEQEKGKNEPKG